MKNLADVYKNSVVVTDVDIDDCEDIADEYGVTSIPRYLCFLLWLITMRVLLFYVVE